MHHLQHIFVCHTFFLPPHTCTRQVCKVDNCHTAPQYVQAGLNIRTRNTYNYVPTVFISTACIPHLHCINRYLHTSHIKSAFFLPTQNGLHVLAGWLTWQRQTHESSTERLRGHYPTEFPDRPRYISISVYYTNAWSRAPHLFSLGITWSNTFV